MRKSVEVGKDGVHTDHVGVVPVQLGARDVAFPVLNSVGERGAEVVASAGQ